MASVAKSQPIAERSRICIVVADMRLEPDGIGVSVVRSGPVDTDAWNSMSYRQPRSGGPNIRAIESKL